MELFDLIKSRRTIRKYKRKKIPRNTIEKIIDAGRWAPSAHNLQPWKFVVVENRDKVKKIAVILEKKADELYSGFNVVMRDTAQNLGRAPLLLAVYRNKVISNKFDRFGYPYTQIGNVYEIQSISTAIENILLYSHSLNLGTAWYGMALFCENEINSLLGQNDQLLAILSLGYPNEIPSSPGRKEIAGITEFIR